MKVLISLLATLGFSASAWAGEYPAQIFGLSPLESQINIALVEQQVTLASVLKDGSDMKVSFLVLDNGGSTDVSPSSTLYLTAFNQSEMRDAASSHQILQINELVSAKRVEAGVYQAVVRLYDFDGGCASWNGNIEGLMRVTIDARQLTADVRTFKGTQEFGQGIVQTPVNVQYSCM